MAMPRILSCLLLMLSTAAVDAEIKTETLSYTVDGTTMTGYLAYDDALSGPRPGVLVVHEWWGQNDYVRKRAEQLAALGYTAFALDMYGEGKVADHPDTAKSFVQTVISNMPIAERRFVAARTLLELQPTVDKQHIAAIGYCFGGGMVLHMARVGMDLDGVVSFHGSLVTKTAAQPGDVKARVLVFTGADDPMVPPEQVQAFEQEMSAANAMYELVSYAGVTHGFTNPAADAAAERFKMPVAYNAQADAASWKRMQAFLKTVFAQ